MVYLVIKELAQTAEDVIMVTSSIMKDTAAVGSDAIYRANAIRALCRIIDVRMLYSQALHCGNMVQGEQCTNSTRYRPRPCRQSNATSKRPLWTNIPPSRLLRWYRHIIYCQSLVTSYDDGSRRHKKLPRPKSHRAVSWDSVVAHSTWLPPGQIT